MRSEVYTVHSRGSGRWARFYSRIYHVLSWMIVATYLAQAVLAGQFLSGSYPALSLHGTGGTVADVIVFGALVVAALLRWHGKGKFWPFWAALGLVVANQVQNAVGAGRWIHLHIPLGVAMLGAAVAVALAASRLERIEVSRTVPPSSEETEVAGAEVANGQAGPT